MYQFGEWTFASIANKKGELPLEDDPPFFNIS